MSLVVSTGFVMSRAGLLPKLGEYWVKAERLFGLIDGFRRRKIHVSGDFVSHQEEEDEEEEEKDRASGDITV